MKKPSILSLLKKVHESEDGSVSLETILIVGAIAIPILIFLIKFGWPKVRDYFNTGIRDLQQESTNAAGASGS